MERSIQDIFHKLICRENSTAYMTALFSFAKMWTCEDNQMVFCSAFGYLQKMAGRIVKAAAFLCPAPQADEEEEEEEEEEEDEGRVLKRQYDVASMVHLIASVVCDPEAVRQVMVYVEREEYKVEGLALLGDLMADGFCCFLNAIKH